MIQEFRPNVFWESIMNGKKNLVQRITFLQSNFITALDQYVDPQNCRNSPQRKLSEIGKKKRINPKVYNEIFDANRVMTSFYHFSKERRRFLSEAEIIDAGFTEDVYKSLLLRVSNYLAELYELEVPKRILDYCGDAPLHDTGISDEIIKSIGEKDLKDNTSAKRFPFVIIVDNAFYMLENGLIDKVMEGTRELLAKMNADDQLKYVIQTYIVATGAGPKVILPFANVGNQADSMEGFSLTPFGPNKMGDTLEEALKTLDDWCRKIIANDSRYFRPWIMILSNGNWKADQNEKIRRISENLKARENDIHLYVRTLGPVSDERMANLKMIGDNVEQLVSLDGFFKDVFTNLRSSRNSSPGGQDIRFYDKEGFGFN